jgi:hypothetical protein
VTTKLSKHGYVIAIDNPSSPQDISSSCGKCDIDPMKAVGEVYTADTGFRQTVESPVKAIQVTVDVVRTTGLTEAYSIFAAWHQEANPTARTLTVSWPGSASGDARVTGEFSLKSFQTARREPGSGEAEILQAVLISDGTFTWAPI